MVLVYYLQVDFLALKNKRALEIGNLFVKGDLRKGLEGVRSLLKPTPSFLFNKKIKFLNLLIDNTQVQFHSFSLNSTHDNPFASDIVYISWK